MKFVFFISLSNTVKHIELISSLSSTNDIFVCPPYHILPNHIDLYNILGNKFEYQLFPNFRALKNITF